MESVTNFYIARGSCRHLPCCTRMYKSCSPAISILVNKFPHIRDLKSTGCQYAKHHAEQATFDFFLCTSLPSLDEALYVLINSENKIFSNSPS